MVSTGLKNDQDKNVAHKNYEDTVNTPSRSYIDDGLADAEKFANSQNDTSNRSLEDAENAANEGFYNPNKNSQKNGKVKGRLNKKNGILGVLITILLGGGLFAGFFGPASMLFQLSENIHLTNDSLSPANERRFTKLFGKMSDGSQEVLCTSAAIKAKCQMGRLSNSALKKLGKKGIEITFEDGSKYDGKRRGYPSKKISTYSIETETGIKHIKPDQLKGYLASDKKVAAKILGSRGAFNLRFKTWTSKTMSKTFSSLNITKSGGMADGKNKTGAKTSESLKKLRDKIPGIEKASNIKGDLQKKLNSKIKKAGKASIAYTVALSGCLVVKAPKFIAAGVAAYQLAQLLPVASEIVMSPASKAKAAGVGSGFSGDDMNAIGSMLTEKTPSPSDPNKKTSALDSKYLLAAMGIGSGKIPVSEKFSPGYGILNNKLIKGGAAVDKATESSCNVITSPTAMYTMMGAEAAIALAIPGLGPIVKFAGGWVVGEIVAATLPKILASLGEDIIKSIADNDNIKKASGEELGDVIGLSSMAMFSAASMSSGLNSLSVDQNIAFNEIKQENETFKRDIDVATLSPFDTASKYTFLGSIVNNINTQLLKRNSINDSPASLLSNIFSLPLMSFSSMGTNSYASSNEAMCSYASSFDMDTGDSATTPAINAAGLPCTGITREQVSMETDEAIDLVSEWLDESKAFNDGDTVTELLESGYIKSDTPLTDYLETCGTPSNGDYIFELAGCISAGSSSNTKKDSLSGQCFSTDATDENEGQTLCQGDAIKDDAGNDIEQTPTPDQRQMLAIPVFLLDLQMSQSINEDELETGTTSTDNTSSSFTIPTGEIKEIAKLINNNSNITDSSNKSGGQIKEIIAGTRNNVSVEPLKAIAALGETYKFTISSMKRDGALSVGAGNASLHLRGGAVDISGKAGINGVTIPNYTSYSTVVSKFLIDTATIVDEIAKNSSRCEIGVPNQSYVNDVKKAVKTKCYVFIDKGTGPHIHIGIKP